MLLLVTDTSGKHGGVGLVRASGSGVGLIESVALAGGTFSAQLVPQISGLLDKHRLSKRDIDAFVAVSGPGSFTGLRVGLAAIKALAEILGKPIVPVSLLQVLAAGSGAHGQVIAVLDAGRGEVYAGQYDLSNSVRLVKEELLTKEQLLSASRGGVLVTPDQALAELAMENGIRFLRVAMPNSQMIALAGWQRLQAGETVSSERLEANYIRRSDAEIFSKSGG
jgi:tRNA threonylcarbamoyladenosine biosynthesis protein TsaB